MNRFFNAKGVKTKQKHKKYEGFSLAELLVAMGIFSILLIMTTQVIVQVSRIKMEAERRADVAENLRVTMERMKKFLLESNSTEVECGIGNSCDLCEYWVGVGGSEKCDRRSGEFRFELVDGKVRQIEYPDGDAEHIDIALTSEDVNITGMTLNQVDEYVFIMLKGQDESGIVIPEGEEVIVQDSVVIRNTE